MLRNCKRNLHENAGISLLFFVFYRTGKHIPSCYARPWSCLYSKCMKTCEPSVFSQLTKNISVL